MSARRAPSTPTVGRRPGVAAAALKLCGLWVSIAALALAARASPMVSPTARAQHAEPSQAALERLLAREFPRADTFSARVATLDERLRADLAGKLRRGEAPRLWRYVEARAGDVVLGRAVSGDVIGKTLPITYAIVFDATVRVRTLEVLEYRESHGGEVRRAKWREQFVGLGADSAPKLRSQVRNIAGATLSCRALIDSVSDALAIGTRVWPAASPCENRTALAAAAAVEGEHSRARPVMGTLLRLRATGVDAARFDAAAEATFARVEALEGLWSTWREDSEVSRLNRAPPLVWCALSRDTLDLIGEAARLREASQGAFAIEAGASVELWAAAEREQREPTDEQRTAAARAGTASAFEFDAAGGRGRRMDAAAKLDFGAIGKGAALDEAARIFAAHGVNRALFDFGGQLLALDGPRDGQGWSVWIRDPRGVDLAPLWELELSNASLATSADDQRGRSIGGRRFSHIVDPRDASCASNALAVCILAPGGSLADAWSTAAFVLGDGLSAKALASHRLARLRLDASGRLLASAGFPGAEGRP